MASNYDDVLSQLRSGGLIVDRLETGKVQRCKVEGGYEKRGWYLLTEWRKDNGDDLLVGSYGVWRGSSNNAQRIVLNGVSLTAEQKAAFKRRLAEDSKRARAQRDQEGYRAAKRAESAWRDCLPDGQSSYLKRKLIDENYGAKYSPKGALVIPMADHSGRCHGLQFILSKDTHASRIEKTGRDKEYWPKGLQKRGHFHLIGSKPERILFIAEGFATAASLHMATNMSVAVAFDANNLQPVAESFKKRYPYLNILICGDDDRWTKDHNGNPWNPGVECASAAALSVTGSWIVPQFSDDALRDQLFADKGEKNSDFNDLHKLDGLDAISNQINAKLEELQWFRRQHESSYSLPEDGQAGELKPIDSYDELLERFALIYGNNGSVFDFQERKVMQLSDMRDACLSRELHRRWQESMLRKIVRPDEVGFDPTETDESIKCNLWGGWPTTPKSGSCEVLLGLLEYLTMNAEDSQLLATRSFQVEEICRIFGVPPHMIGHTEKATSWGTGIEQMSIGFVKFTLQPHLVAFEQEINSKVFRTPKNFCEFQTAGLERGDIKARYEGYRIAIGRAGEPGWMTVNEVRNLENQLPRDGGDSLYQPNQTSNLSAA